MGPLKPLFWEPYTKIITLLYWLVVILTETSKAVF